MTPIKLLRYLIIFYIFTAFLGCNPIQPPENSVLIFATPSEHFLFSYFGNKRYTEDYKVTFSRENHYLNEDSLEKFQAVVLTSEFPLNLSEKIELKRYLLAGGGILYYNIDEDSSSHNNKNQESFENLVLEIDQSIPTSSKPNLINIDTKSPPIFYNSDVIYSEDGPGRYFTVTGLSTPGKLAQLLSEGIDYLIVPEKFPDYQHVAMTKMPPTEKFSQHVIADQLINPADFEILDNGDIILIERSGNVYFLNNKNYKKKLIADSIAGHGVNIQLNSVAKDLHYAQNHWIYFSYQVDSNKNVLSRFYLAEDSLIINSKKIIFEQDSSFISADLFSENLLIDSPQIFSVLRHYKIASSELNENSLIAPDSIMKYQSTVRQGSIKYQPIYSYPQPIVNETYPNAVYLYNSYINSKDRFPAYYDGKEFYFDKTTKQIRFSENSEDKKSSFPLIDSISLKQPMSMKFGADGALYVLDYGEYPEALNADAQLIRITFENKNRKPTAILSANASYGSEPLTVNFNGKSSYDLDYEDSLQYTWLVGDSVFSKSRAYSSFVFTNEGIYYPKLLVTDKYGHSDVDSIKIQVGNSAPRIILTSEKNTSFYWKNGRIPYEIKVMDLEDETLIPTKITFSTLKEDSNYVYQINEDTGYGFVSETNHGNLPVIIEPEGELKFSWKIEEEDPQFVINVEVNDSGSGPIAPCKVNKKFILRHPKLWAFDCDSLGGAVKKTDRNVQITKPMGYVQFNQIDMTGINHIKYRFKAFVSGQFSLRIGSLSGPDLSRINIRENDQNWHELTARVGAIEGKYDLFFTFESDELLPETESAQSAERFVLEWIYFGQERMGRLTNSPFNSLDIVE